MQNYFRIILFSAVILVSIFINDVLFCGGQIGDCDGNSSDAVRNW